MMMKGKVNNDRFKVSKHVIIVTFFLFLVLIVRLCYLCVVDYKVGDSTTLKDGILGIITIERIRIKCRSKRGEQ